MPALRRDREQIAMTYRDSHGTLLCHHGREIEYVACLECNAEYEQESAGLEAALQRIAALAAELAWYGEQARLCRLIHSEGDAGRNALAADGGKRAQAVLARAQHPVSET